MKKCPGEALIRSGGCFDTENFQISAFSASGRGDENSMISPVIGCVKRM